MEPAVKRLLPPDSSSGAASNMRTEAPCSCAANAAQNAAFPAPTTITSDSLKTISPVALSPFLGGGSTAACGALLRYNLPFDDFATAIDQRALIGTVHLDLLRRCPRRAFQRDRPLIGRKTVVIRAVERSKSFKLVQCALLLEYFGI